MSCDVKKDTTNIGKLKHWATRSSRSYRAVCVCLSNSLAFFANFRYELGELKQNKSTSIKNRYTIRSLSFSGMGECFCLCQPQILNNYFVSQEPDKKNSCLIESYLKRNSIASPCVRSIASPILLKLWLETHCKSFRGKFSFLQLNIPKRFIFQLSQAFDIVSHVLKCFCCCWNVSPPAYRSVIQCLTRVLFMNSLLVAGFLVSDL